MPLVQLDSCFSRHIVAAGLALVVATPAVVNAQVFGPGPSDPSLFVNGVFNVPPDVAPDSVGDLQQLNVSDGGSVGFGFNAESGSEVNISGGSVGSSFDAESGSEVNISGGSVGINFDAFSGSVVNISGGSVEHSFDAESGSEVNISGGSVGSGFEAKYGSEVNISGGSVGNGFDASFGSVVSISGGSVGNLFEAFSDSVVSISGGTVGGGFDAESGSVVNISGGSVGRGFDAVSGSDVELIGGEFQLNGAAFAGSAITLVSGDVFTGTLQDGSTFIFATEDNDSLSNVTLTSVALPAIDTTPIVVNTALPNRPSGLRAGQTLTLQDGGQLVNFEATGGTLNIEGGSLGDDAGVINAVVNISGGSVGSNFDAKSGSEVNISGGTVGGGFHAKSGSEVNISGGSVGRDFDAVSGSEVNISGGGVGIFFDAFSGSVVSISGGSVGGGFDAFSGSVVNISGGSVGINFDAVSGSVVNLFGAEFSIDGVLLEELVFGEAFTITERDIVLSGILADGSDFTFDLQSDVSISANALLSITLVTLKGDYNADGVVNAADYVVWRDGASSGSSTNGYDVWANHYGSRVSGTVVPELASSVPEPSSAALMVSCLVLIVRRSRIRRWLDASFDCLVPGLAIRYGLAQPRAMLICQR